MEGQRRKKVGLKLFETATWHRGLLERRVVSSRPVAPEIIQKEADAHQATVAAISSIWTWAADDELVEATTAETPAQRYALVHMLADAWRVLVQTIPYQLNQQIKLQVPST